MEKQVTFLVQKVRISYFHTKKGKTRTIQVFPRYYIFIAFCINSSCDDRKVYGLYSPYAFGSDTVKICTPLSNNFNSYFVAPHSLHLYPFGTCLVDSGVSTTVSSYASFTKTFSSYAAWSVTVLVPTCTCSTE